MEVTCVTDIQYTHAILLSAKIQVCYTVLKFIQRHRLVYTHDTLQKVLICLYSTSDTQYKPVNFNSTIVS